MAGEHGDTARGYRPAVRQQRHTQAGDARFVLLDLGGIAALPGRGDGVAQLRGGGLRWGIGVEMIIGNRPVGQDCASE
ncbi:hypothetical protein SDC9_158487 [bioreactor metagenome]|uniref:Uncharacterized protein n=1 Tax=bioreactor metagenome TaxID=1076179 RepID=A0A645FC26_9ZZZZ